MGNCTQNIKNFEKINDGKRHDTRFPRTILSTGTKSNSERSCLSPGPGILKIYAEGDKAAVFATAFSEIYLASGHIHEYTGELQPKIPLRPIFLLNKLDPLSPDRANYLGQRILEMGYNALVIPEPSGVDAAVIHALQSKGVSCIYKMNPSALTEFPGQPHYKEKIINFFEQQKNFLRHYDSIFWYSNVTAGSKTPEDFRLIEETIEEIIREEMQAVEAVSPLPVIFYVPTKSRTEASRQAAWLLRLCAHTGPNTLIAFSAVSGDPEMDYRDPNPLWDKIREYKGTRSLPFIPLVNAGAVGHGEGLWPTLPVDLIEKYIRRAADYRFGGIAVLAGNIPRPLGFLDCCLWVAAQVMWKDLTLPQIVDTWFKARMPGVEYAREDILFRAVREIAMDLEKLKGQLYHSNTQATRSEEWRFTLENLQAKLSGAEWLERNLSRLESKGNQKSSLSEYFHFFYKDVKRMISHFYESQKINPLHNFESVDLGEAFWTKGTQQGMSMPTIHLLDKPQKGGAGSRMEMIFKENRLLPGL